MWYNIKVKYWAVRLWSRDANCCKTVCRCSPPRQLKGTVIARRKENGGQPHEIGRELYQKTRWAAEGRLYRDPYIYASTYFLKVSGCVFYLQSREQNRSVISRAFVECCSAWQGTGDVMHQPLKSADFSLVGEVPKPLVAWATASHQNQGKEWMKCYLANERKRNQYL